MARPLRMQYPGAVYHITSRGNERKPIFKDHGDRQTFLALLNNVNFRFRWICHAYCLMDNHYHLIIETPEGNLVRGMRQLNGVYTQSFNRKYHRAGHLFQGRYKAILVEKESYLLEVCRYVVLNPVRAKAVTRPERWRWSSYRGTAGLETPPACLTADWVLGRFGNNRPRAEKRYREFVSEGIGRDSIWDQLKGQSLLGEESFVLKMRPYLRRHEGLREIPRSQRYLGRSSLTELFGSALRGDGGDKAARNKRILEAVIQCGYSQKEVADYLRMHYSTISRLMATRE